MSEPADPLSESPGATGADPAVGALLAAHGVAAVALRGDGRVTWANDVARSLVTEPGTTAVSVDAVDETLRRSLTLPDHLLAGLTPGEVRRGALRIAATHALLEPEAAVLGVGAQEGTVALVTWAAEPAVAGAHDDHIRRLEAMLASTTDVITVIDHEGTIRYSNAAAQRLTGISGVDANGLSMLEFVHPDEHGLALATLERIVDGEVVEPVELRLRHADGSWHHAEVHVADPTEHDAVDGVVLTIRDITDRVRRQEELARNERRLESIVENIDDVIVVLDRSLAVTWVSPGIERLIDAPAYTNLGENAFNDMHPDDIDGAVAVILAAMETPEGRGRVELRLRHEQLGWRWVEAAVVNRLEDPAVGGLVCTLRDITDQRTTSVELRRINDEQRAVADRLRDMDRVKDQFLATLSHELRTPLTSVRGFSEVLLRRSGQLDPTTRDELLSRIHANATEMEDMVQQLLDFSRLQARRVEVAPETVDLVEAIGSLVDRLAHHLAEHEVQVATGACWAMADRRALDHVLRNLLTNAARYSDPGSRIEVSATPHDGEVWVSVRDEGIGIAPEEQTAVFQSFYQAAPGVTGRRGTGVGLNIARRYAQLQGGRLWLESSPGKGSTFYLALPAADDG